MIPEIRQRNYCRHLSEPTALMNCPVRLTQDEKRRLSAEAIRRGFKVTGLVGMLLGRVIADNLFKAILDE